MKIVDYYKTDNRRIPSDKTMGLAQEEISLALKEKELLVRCRNESSADFSGDAPELKITGSGSKHFEELKRLQKVRQKNLDKIAAIENFISKYTDICSESEFQYIRNQKEALELKLNGTLDFYVLKLQRKFPSQCPNLCSLGRGDLKSDNLPPEVYLRRGIALQTRKIIEFQQQVDDMAKQIEGWRNNEVEINEFIDKIVGDK